MHEHEYCDKGPQLARLEKCQLRMEEKLDRLIEKQEQIAQLSSRVNQLENTNADYTLPTLRELKTFKDKWAGVGALVIIIGAVLNVVVLVYSFVGG